MPTSEHALLDLIRSHFAAAIEARDDAHLKLDRAMSHLKDLIENGRRLAGERTALIDDRDAERDRADAAEAHAAELQSKLDADDETARAAKEDLDAEIAKEAGVSGAAPKPDVEKQPETVAPIETLSPTGADISTVPTADGATTHTDVMSTVTTLDHATGVTTAKDATGEAVEPSLTAVAEATAAAVSAGVMLPQPEGTAIPTTVG